MVVPAHEQKPSEYLEVADFVHVVCYDKDRYPKGVKTYKVAQDKAEADEKD